MSDNIKLGFVGLGNMGEPMAKSLANAGRKPLVFDLRNDAMDKLASHGALRASSIADLVAKLVAGHGGLIDFESEPGRTTFRVLLPAVPAPSAFLVSR